MYSNNRIKIFFIILNFILFSCINKQFYLKSNINPLYISFVPARTAVFPCMKWPNKAYFKNLAMTNFSQEHLNLLCEEFEKFIIKGFTNQPYMKGYSPTAVQKILEQANYPPILEDITKIWTSDITQNCIKCSAASEYYEKSIEIKQQWQKWVYDISTTLNHSDTILMPFVLYGYEIKYKERGFWIYKKAASVIMLLIDTSNAKLIWHSNNEAFCQTQKEIHQQNTSQDLEEPSLDILKQRLFSNILWKEYPGRLVINQ